MRAHQDRTHPAHGHQSFTRIAQILGGRRAHHKQTGGQDGQFHPDRIGERLPRLKLLAFARRNRLAIRPSQGNHADDILANDPHGKLFVVRDDLLRRDRNAHQEVSIQLVAVDDPVAIEVRLTRQSAGQRKGEDAVTEFLRLQRGLVVPTTGERDQTLSRLERAPQFLRCRAKSGGGHGPARVAAVEDQQLLASRTVLQHRTQFIDAPPRQLGSSPVEIERTEKPLALRQHPMSGEGDEDRVFRAHPAQQGGDQGLEIDLVRTEKKVILIVGDHQHMIAG